ncbi:MAG: SDR family NAD(P)-dependent oxidoreductase [Deferribacteres bacterium]|nr:SDR family NAD(P)-dependent oxidoreductase [candidate division KSB1 bacterium]MCB9503150.1 SDR family NAD(P)-dependent oxidoreductase [Deferribacteres bacterium]
MNIPNHLAVFGATSEIAWETCKHFAEQGAHLYLCARKEDDLQRLADDLLTRGARSVAFCPFDATEEKSIDLACSKILNEFPRCDGLYIAHGFLPPNEDNAIDLNIYRTTMQINYFSVVQILEKFIPHFIKLKYGKIAVISSVAGERGKKRNAAYSAAKAALTTFLSGLRQKTKNTNIQVITLKPGTVITPMTANLPQNFLFTRAEKAGRLIYDSFKKKNENVYIPGFWRYIMLITRIIPEKIFKHLNL